MPECVLRTLGPITPGKLTGLEVHVFGMQAEDDLAEMLRMHGAFNGGNTAKSHARWLEDRLAQYRSLCDGRPRKPYATKEEIAAFAQILKDRGH